MSSLIDVAFVSITFQRNKDLRDGKKCYPTCRRDKKGDMMRRLIVVRPKDEAL